MNTSALLASSFFLALFAFTGAEFIYDSDGDIVSNGGKYYLLPRREGGGAIKGATINKPKSRSCYLAVVAEPLNENGWAVKIGTPYRLFHISDDHPLNVSFARLPSNACTHSPSWIVASVTGLDTDPVMVGKPEEFSVPRSGYFYIKKYESTQFYSFVFCY
ncbi:trypsin inhibitor-like [Prosopis cineraria]|nr:trypsin inhibitor-like [Prosopis cineraria]